MILKIPNELNGKVCTGVPTCSWTKTGKGALDPVGYSPPVPNSTWSHEEALVVLRVESKVGTVYGLSVPFKAEPVACQGVGC